MLSSIVVVAIAALAHAAPLEERAKTVTEVTDVYLTVYEDAPAATAAAATAEEKKWWWKGNRGGQATGTTVVYVTPTPVADTPVADAPAPVAEKSTPVAEKSTPVADKPASSPTASSGNSYSGPDSYSKAIVAHHNAHRANHSAPDLAWDDALAATALKTAKSCNYAHDTATDGGGYGQNIAAGCPADNVTSIITELFYNAEVTKFSEYGQKTPASINDEKSFDGWGHFTQIVWKSTSKVGCATYDCSKSGGLKGTGSSVAAIFTVCNYKSPGLYLPSPD
ncbi:PR-1-like protein [Tothia fuscella]|uniref:PR-1-like protein n=1 Tax=Tothia fuscella TaxID=1048955 RepID=A0A9P4NVS5_9PEZI|nr:PR-1-like protein [Tothia fuscella]